MNVTMDVVVKWEALFGSLGERFSVMLTGPVLNLSTDMEPYAHG
jgi:hypothetical protein